MQDKILQNSMQVMKNRKLIKFFLKHYFNFHKNFMSFEMAPNNFEFDFEQICFNPFESPWWKFFQDDRDLDLNYFDGINIVSKEMTYINETDIKSFLYETQDMRTFLFFVLT